METVNKKQAIKIIKESTNFEATIEYIQNSFAMNIKGDSMPKQEEQISLKSIYEFVLNIKTEIQDIKDNIKNIKVDINTLKRLPTISSELKIYNLNHWIPFYF